MRVLKAGDCATDAETPENASVPVPYRERTLAGLNSGLTLYLNAAGCSERDRCMDEESAGSGGHLKGSCTCNLGVSLAAEDDARDASPEDNNLQTTGTDIDRDLPAALRGRSA